MRILQATTDTDRRGAQIFAHELAPFLGDNDWRVRTVALAPGGNGPQLPFDILGSHRLAPSTLWHLRRALSGADAVIGYGSTTLPACALTILGTGVPFVYRSIGDLTYWADSRAKRFRVGTFLHRTRHVVALWPAAATAISDNFGIPGHRVSVIPRGADPVHFRATGDVAREGFRRSLGLPLTSPVACLVGSLTQEKALDVAVTAASRIDGLHLVVAGNGPLYSEIRAMADRLMPQRTTFLGRVRDTRPVYGASDLLLLTSWSEGVPGVVIEAGLSGRPAVATDVGGTSSVIEDGHTGKLVPAGDVEAVSSALTSTLREADEMGRAARKAYEWRFALKTVGRQWTEVLNHLHS